MSNRSKIDRLVSYFGFFPFVRKLASKVKYNHLQSMFISKEQIERGEADKGEMKRIAADFRSRHPSWYREDVRKIDSLIDQFSTADGDAEEIRDRLYFDRIGRGFLPEEIVCYELFDKPAREKALFMSSRDTSSATLRMNDLRDIDTFNNKGMTYRRFGKYYHRDAIYLSSQGDLDDYLRFIQKHPVYVKKAVFEAMGRSVELIDTTAHSDPRALFNEMLKAGPHLIEEQVKQSDDIARLNASSVNTIRCITFNTKSGIADPYYFMKIGRAGSFVDNGGAGGILVGIDNETGKLNTDGFDEHNHRYPAHPDSGVVFKGYQLPEWDNMKRICKEMSASIPSVKFIGWDLAHTNDGWVVIEGNGCSQLIGPQTVFKRGIKKEVAEIMANMDLLF